MPNTPDIYYSSNAATYDMRMIFPQFRGVNVSAGVNGVYQNSRSLGTLMLIPDYHFFQIGGFVMADRTIGPFHLSGGLRYDTRDFHGGDHWIDSTTQAPESSGDPNAFHEFQGFGSHFRGMSFSAGAVYHLSGKVYLKGNIARGWRAPNVAECGANGVHDGTVVYEIGDPTLRPETSLEEDLVFGVNTRDIDLELNLFNNTINDFIYARGLQSAFGGDSINNSLNAAGLGEAPVYKYSQGKARLYGGEVDLHIHPSATPWVELNAGLSQVVGSLLNTPDSIKYLPFVPPTRITAELKFRLAPSAKGIKNAYIKAGMLDCFQQNKIYQQYAIYNGLNTALTPFEYAASRSASAGYTLFNAGAGADIMTKGHVFCKVYLLCNNLFNTAYIDYMSRFKYYPVNYTTGRVGVYNMGRNLSVKVLIPIDFNAAK
jgi:iron complex outermembrane recepter protein